MSTNDGHVEDCVLYQCCRDGDIELLSEILYCKDSNIDCSQFGFAAMQCAMRNGDEKMVSMFVDCGKIPLLKIAEKVEQTDFSFLLDNREHDDLHAKFRRNVGPFGAIALVKILDLLRDKDWDDAGTLESTKDYVNKWHQHLLSCSRFFSDLPEQQKDWRLNMERDMVLALLARGQVDLAEEFMEKHKVDVERFKMVDLNRFFTTKDESGRVMHPYFAPLEFLFAQQANPDRFTFEQIDVVSSDDDDDDDDDDNNNEDENPDARENNDCFYQLLDDAMTILCGGKVHNQAKLSKLCESDASLKDVLALLVDTQRLVAVMATSALEKPSLVVNEERLLRLLLTPLLKHMVYGWDDDKCAPQYPISFFRQHVESAIKMCQATNKEA